MQIITKNIRWRALIETYQTAKFDRSPNNLSWDILLTDRWPEQKKRKKKGKMNKKSKNNRSAFACRSKYHSYPQGCRDYSKAIYRTTCTVYGCRKRVGIVMFSLRIRAVTAVMFYSAILANIGLKKNMHSGHVRVQYSDIWACISFLSEGLQYGVSQPTVVISRK